MSKMERYPLYRRGVWTEIDVPDIYSDFEDLSKARHAAGWTGFFNVGADDLRITVWDRNVNDTAGPRYVLDVFDWVVGTPEVWVGDHVDVMDLLTRWAPAVQAAVLCSLLGAANEPTSRTSSIAMIAKHVKMGLYG